MSSLRQPVGPRSPATYWRRRVIVLAVVLLLAYLPVRACGGEGESGGERKNQARPAPAAGMLSSASATPSPTGSPIEEAAGGPSGDAASAATGGTGGTGGTGTGAAGGGQPSGQGGEPVAGAGGPTDGGAVDCAAGDFALTTRTDQRTYGTSATPRFTLTVRNVGSRPCRLDVGQNAAELLVTSGPDRVWSSADCAQRQTGNVQRLEPGRSLLLMQVAWDRTRTMRGCPTALPQARTGTYVLTGGLRGLASTKDVFDLR